MKKIRYKILSYHQVFNEKTGQADKLERYVTVTANDTEAERQIAAIKAYDGAYESFDDGQTEVPSRLDALEAQVAYTAVMTDTLAEV